MADAGVGIGPPSTTTRPNGLDVAALDGASVVLLDARSRRQASAPDGASAWIRALATRLALALTGRV